MMTNSELFKQAARIHFVGIGGIGVSALARMAYGMGKVVTGSDIHSSQLTETLIQEGIKVFYGHQEANVSADTNLVVYTIAVKHDNPELVEAHKLNIPTLTYAQALGAVSAGMYTIAVSGTHGKTTTTAMIGKLLQDGGFDPTIVVGSLLKDHGSNYVQGGSKPARPNASPTRSFWRDSAHSGGYFVAEACEYQRSFLNLQPTILVITNIEEDHLDYYKDLADIQSAFQTLALSIPQDGFIVCNGKDPNIKDVIKDVQCSVIDYSNIQNIPALQIPGEHNRRNAQAALSVAQILGITIEVSRPSIQGFSGTWRRFEYKGETSSGAKVYDDYAHHPTEIAATLQGAREKFPDKKIIIAFQPHLYSRTKEHLGDFIKILSEADTVLLAPIYAAREKDPGDISHHDIAEKIPGALAFESLEEITMMLKKISGPDNIILVMGAGDITHVASNLVVKTMASGVLEQVI